MSVGDFSKWPGSSSKSSSSTAAVSGEGGGDGSGSRVLKLVLLENHTRCSPPSLPYLSSSSVIPPLLLSALLRSLFSFCSVPSLCPPSAAAAARPSVRRSRSRRRRRRPTRYMLHCMRRLWSTKPTDERRRSDGGREGREGRRRMTSLAGESENGSDSVRKGGREEEREGGRAAEEGRGERGS